MSKNVILSSDLVRSMLCYNENTGVFTWIGHNGRNRRRHVGDIAGSLNNKGYWVVHINYKSYFAHRLAWLYVHGTWPVNQIDHIDGDRLNNSIANLRSATSSQNSMNRRVTSKKSGKLKGTSFCKARNQWEATIMVNGKSRFLGRFQTAEQAHSAYVDAAIANYEQFARVA